MGRYLAKVGLELTMGPLKTGQHDSWSMWEIAATAADPEDAASATNDQDRRVDGQTAGGVEEPAGQPAGAGRGAVGRDARPRSGDSCRHDDQR